MSSKDKLSNDEFKGQGFNRRDFLKVITAGSALAASGCAKDVPEKLIPYVIQPDEVVPGNATWYAGTCDECSAGCGILVRTKEGRALKVEGNPQHPVNRGGLCALGQSSVQGLYDPDRVREPLKRGSSESFKPTTWKDAIDLVSEELSKAEEASLKTVFITKPLQLSEKKIFSEFLSKYKKSDHYEYDLLAQESLSVAAKALYQKDLSINFSLNNADVIFGVGADYLETWISPVKFSKDFSKRRVPTGSVSISKVYHIEPRLSLTAANADFWYKNAPQTELLVLKAVLSKVSSKRSISGALKKSVEIALSNFSLTDALKSSGIDEAKINKISNDLISAKSSLVLSGGASVGAASEATAFISLLLNEILGNVGKTVLYTAKQNQNKILSPQNIKNLVSEINSGTVSNVVFVDVNPAFSLPQSSGFHAALSKVKFVVSMTKSQDETAQLSNVILPLSTNFESWSDSEPEAGVLALNQPSMQPLYKTQGFGDIIISLDNSAKNKQGGQFKEFSEFKSYIESEWKKRLGDAKFKSSWSEIVSAGGLLSQNTNSSTSSSPSVSEGQASSIFKKAEDLISKKAGLTFVAFPTVHYHDGRGANRSWMQEIPDPMTTAVWGSWIEIHPDTAELKGFKHGDIIQVKTSHGSVEAPAYVTKHIHPNLVAAPLGLGHSGYGRYASGIGSNATSGLDFVDALEQISLVASNVTILPSIANDSLVTLQFSDTEYQRGFIRGITEKEYKHSLHAHDDHSSHHGGGHHDPLALGPRDKPKQMYEQMDHPVYKWGMSIDLSSCTGCSACVAACYAENNVPVVGKQVCDQGREMSWIKIARYLDGPEEHPVTGFAPSLCQHCGNAPCEPVCPVYGTYHSEDGLNTMVYNRCVGTRYCSNNCSYKVRRFNWFNYEWPEPLNWQLNPDVTVRSVGVMEKCSFCIQRIREGQNNAKNEGRAVQEGEIKPACASSCPTNAIKFGNLLDEKSEVAKDAQSKRGYKILDVELNTQPAITYLAKVNHEQLVKPKGHSGDDHHSDNNHGGSNHGSDHGTKVSNSVANTSGGH